MSARAEQKRRTRARVLERATACFEELGYAETTIRRVAARAEVSVGAVIAHFPDKPSLVAAAFHATLQGRIDAGFATLPEGGVHAQLMHLARALYVWYAAHPRLGAALIRETLFLGGEHGAAHAQQAAEFMGRVAALIEADPAPRAEPALLAQAFFSDYLAVLIQALRHAQSAPFDLEGACQRLSTATSLRLLTPPTPQGGEP